MTRLGRYCALCLLALTSQASAQLYGVSPYQNGPGPDQGGLFVFDPDSLTWLSSVQINTTSGPTASRADAVTMHPFLAPPNTANNGRLYALLRTSGVNNSVLATIQPETGQATVIATLNDRYAALAFSADGQLFGLTTDSASQPSTLYLLNKQNGASTLAAALPSGADGEAMAYNPDDGWMYHWSGPTSSTFEKLQLTPPYLRTAIPVFDPTQGETFGAVWDPCLARTAGGTTATGFIASNNNSSFSIWLAGGRVAPVASVLPDAMRGLALADSFGCQADLGVGLASPNASPPAGSTLTLDVMVANAGPARARTPTLTITLPPSLSAASTEGCVEDPAGVPTCTLKPQAQRYNTATGQYTPFQLASLWGGRNVSMRIQTTYNGGGGQVQVSASSAATELQPADNQMTLGLGDQLLRDGFED